MMMPEPATNSCASADRINLILDSGAFSAWKLGKTINMREYCEYIEKNQDWIAHYINLDCINPADPEAAAAIGFENLLYMRKRGLQPMPVFHIGEDISWLHRMLDLGCDYIGIGALSMRASDRADQFYSYVFSNLVTADGSPIVKLHGLGEGRAGPLKRFPWASADSTSWIYTAQRTGQLQLTASTRISIRNDGGGSKASPALHGLSDLDKAELDRFMAESGVDLSSFDYAGKAAWVMRGYMMVLYYQRLQQEVRKAQPIYFHPRGFFKPLSYANAIASSPFHLHLVFQDNNATWELPTYAKHHNVLISYYYIMARACQRGEDPTALDFRAWVNDPWVYASQFQKAKHIWEILEKYARC